MAAGCLSRVAIDDLSVSGCFEEDTTRLPGQRRNPFAPRNVPARHVGIPRRSRLCSVVFSNSARPGVHTATKGRNPGSNRLHPGLAQSTWSRKRGSVGSTAHHYCVGVLKFELMHWAGYAMTSLRQTVGLQLHTAQEFRALALHVEDWGLAMIGGTTEIRTHANA